MKKANILLGIMAVLAMATSAMAIPSSGTELWWEDFDAARPWHDEWSVIGGHVDVELQTYGANNSFHDHGDGTTHGGLGRGCLWLRPAVARTGDYDGDYGITNTLNDGGDRDPLGTGESFAPTPGNSLRLETYYKTYSDKNPAEVDWEIQFTDGTGGHSMAIGSMNPMSPTVGYSLNGDTWIDTEMTLSTDLSNVWDCVYMEVHYDGSFTIGLESVNDSTTYTYDVASGYTGWGFTTINFISLKDPCTKAGFISDINVWSTPIPEPAMLTLLGFGLPLVMRRRRR